MFTSGNHIVLDYERVVSSEAALLLCKGVKRYTRIKNSNR